MVTGILYMLGAMHRCTRLFDSGVEALPGNPPSREPSANERWQIGRPAEPGRSPNNGRRILRIKRLARLLAASLIFLAFNSPAPASVPASGEFTATQACEAYQSFRRKTNPGEVRLDIGQSYPVFELNVREATTWYRLRIDDATPAERWVYFECGTAELGAAGTGSNGGDADDRESCNTPGREDSYVLALSWQPAFCETHRDKPECAVTEPESYQATHFTLHGLWPNKRSCGTHYGWCGEYSRGRNPFCLFDPVPMQDTTREVLGKVMPSAAHGSCLQRHEWYKHGTCQTTWDADSYFLTAMWLLREFNANGMAAFMERNTGESVPSEAFFDAVDDAFGPDAHRRLQISCREGKLVDVYINLPDDFPVDASLGDLMQLAEPNFRNRCGTQFEIDPIGFQ